MASTTNTLVSRYSVLDPDERMSAVLEALARQDNPEAQRLQDACPRRNYSVPDGHYADRLLLALDAAAVAAIELRGLLAQLRSLRWAVAAARELIPLHRFEAELTFMQGVKAGAKSLDAAVISACLAECRTEIEARSAFSVGKFIELLDEGAQITAGDLAAAWEAYQQFCRTGPGVAASTLLAARGLHALAGDVKAAMDHYQDVQADPGKVARFMKLIAEPWQRQFDDQTSEASL